MSEFVYLSDKMMSIIGQLTAGERYGLQLVAGSRGQLARSSIYVFLARMEDKGLIEGHEEAVPTGSPGPPRRVYKLTEYGQLVLTANTEARRVMATAIVRKR